MGEDYRLCEGHLQISRQYARLYDCMVQKVVFWIYAEIRMRDARY